MKVVDEDLRPVIGRLSVPGPARSDAGSTRKRFQRMLAEASRRLRSSETARGVEAPDGRQAIRMVRAGETLSQMVEGVLRESGMRVGPRATYRAVSEVGKANRLANPDCIRPGQPIDFSAALPGRPAGELVGVDVGADGLMEELSLARIGQGLKAFFGSLAGRITSAFGRRIDPVTGSRSFHTGVDIRMPAGSFVYPVLPGRVIFSGWSKGYGNLIRVAHADGFTTSYGHNAANLIPVGVIVDPDVPIAIAGASGKATGRHLHFEVRRNGRPIDPGMVPADEGIENARQD